MPAEDKKKLTSEDEPEDDARWGRDIEERGYYYDDSTGYEVYQPENEDDADENNEDLNSKANK